MKKLINVTVCNGIIVPTQEHLNEFNRLIGNNEGKQKIFELIYGECPYFGGALFRFKKYIIDNREHEISLTDLLKTFRKNLNQFRQQLEELFLDFVSPYFIEKMNEDAVIKMYNKRQNNRYLRFGRCF